MGHHDLSKEELTRYKELALAHPENPHFEKVVSGGKWISQELGLLHCWYCGSLKPECLLQSFKDGKVSEYSGSDWKYGYPHKFYLSVYSGKPGESFYEVDGREVTEDEFYVAKSGGIAGRRDGTGNVSCKFYTLHLEDIEDHLLFVEITELLEDKFRIHFEMREGKVCYRAPCSGFQV